MLLKGRAAVKCYMWKLFLVLRDAFIGSYKSSSQKCFQLGKQNGVDICLGYYVRTDLQAYSHSLTKSVLHCGGISNTKKTKQTTKKVIIMPDF